MYLRLFLCSLEPVAASLIFYTLEKKLGFWKKLPYMLKQVIIGLVFGGIAVLGTEFGVDVGGAAANVRDASPLCAGLIFGGPAGIIAGIIGGVERWLAVYWGVGAYSRVACSVSTILAGFYAALLRKHLFEDKFPTPGFGFITGVIMEALHLTILFMTHLSSPSRAFEIVKIVTVPMVLFNALALFMALLPLNVQAGRRLLQLSGRRTISQQVQTRLLGCVIAAYLVTTSFVYILQTQNAHSDASLLLSNNIEDVKADIDLASDKEMLRITEQIADELNSENPPTLDELMENYTVSEINIINRRNIIYNSTNPDFVGFDMNTGEQSRAFNVLNEGVESYVQAYQHIDFSPDDDSYARKYAAWRLRSSGYVQVGYTLEMFQSQLIEQVDGLTQNRRVGTDGYILITQQDGTILSGKEWMPATLEELGLSTADRETGQWYSGEANGTDVIWMFDQAEGLYVVAVYPQSEAYYTRDAEVYINSFMEILVFALLFFFIYSFLRRGVVDRIRQVNRGLGSIIDGNLDRRVEVNSSQEFADLSSDINQTVTTLKHYIDEAASRLDKDLALAQSIQLATLPSVFPAYPNRKEFDIFASMDPAREVGGDFYDFYMPDEDHLVFLVADVSGKGIPAAMFMMTAKTLLKSLTESGLPLGEAMQKANDRLCANNEADMFVTCWMGKLDLRTGHVEYVNAGHNPPVLRSADGSWNYLKSKVNLVLAGMEGVPYRSQELTLKPGEAICLYTDGVTESHNENKELYGEERLQTYLNAHGTGGSREILKGLKADVDRYAEKVDQFDDITMLLLQVNSLAAED